MTVVPTRLVWILPALLLTQCLGTGVPLPEVTPRVNATLTMTPLVLAPGDQLSIKFPLKVERDHQAVVQSDGRATFLYLNSLQVAGLTPEQLDKQLTESYTKLGLQDPEVDVFLTGRSPRQVYVAGEVNRPGQIILDTDRLSLVEAIGRAGGPNKATAYLENTLLIRWVPQENRQLVWNIDASIDYWNGSTPLMLQAYDVIYVPNTAIDRVDIFIDQYIRQLIPLPGFSAYNQVFVGTP
jgi:protein involved in polysaccharide export with SLBB domain